jgi:hypothetical protein
VGPGWFGMGSGALDLPPDIVDLLRRGRGLVTASAARAAGVGDDRLRRQARLGTLTPLARGCYAATALLEGMSEWALFRERARAFALASTAESFLVGWGAVANWGLRTWGRPPELPTLVRPKTAGRGPTATAYGRTLVADLAPEHQVRRPGWGIMSKAWTAVDLARTVPVPHALVVADSAVRKGADLAAVLAHFGRWDGVARARFVVQHADSNAESPLETLGRFTCIEFNLPMPVSNAWVGIDGPEKRLDGLWPFHRSAYEADGAVKYNNRDDAAQIVRAEHEREFYLRRLGLDIIRYGAPDVYPVRRGLAARFRALLLDNPPSDEPMRWWKHVPGKGPVEPSPHDWPSPHPLGLILPAGWNR